ncbi:MAG: hypothetical protein K6G11_06390, partial [Lachnospiraceae bacterium]|nr:hypothetical protein [Lachnospiraceae bacterium]
MAHKYTPDPRTRKDHTVHRYRQDHQTHPDRMAHKYHQDHQTHKGRMAPINRHFINTTCKLLYINLKEL